MRAKISAKLKGRRAPWTEGDKNVAKRPEVREKIKNNKNSQQTRFKKGQIPWNKNLTVKTSPLVKLYTQKATKKRRTKKFKRMARQNVLKNYLQGKWKSDSPAEEEMEVILQRAGLKKDKDFFHPYIIGDFVFDFFIKHPNLVIEIDGREHRHSKKVKALDKVKEQHLQDNNYLLARFRNEEIFGKRDEIISLINDKLLTRNHKNL